MDNNISLMGSVFNFQFLEKNLTPKNLTKKFILPINWQRKKIEN